MTHRPQHSPEKIKQFFSPKGFSKVTRKHQINRKGLVIREIPTPVSPGSKKRRAEDMEKCISKMKKKPKVVEESMEEVVPESPIHEFQTSIPSPVRGSPVKLNAEET